MVGEGGMLDVANPVTRQWMTDRYRKLTDMGMSGWWGDLGEPEVHPETGYHANGLTARQYHNRYGNDWASIISDLFAEQYPDTRLMTLMRGGTTGLQRQSVFPWTTDVSRSWGGLEPQIRIMLHSGLSGLGYMSSDLGGFAVDQNNPYLPELYLRWLEAGLFTPVFRTHSQQFAEVFNYPQYHDTLLKLIRERYRWLPYNYTLAFENATQGWPLARPIDFFDGSDGALDEYFATEYLWGRDVLVAPVITEGADSREVYFPVGSDWINANDTREIYRGGTTARIAAPLDVLPYFFRAGSLIPSADYLMENTGEYRSDEFTINYYRARTPRQCFRRQSPLAREHRRRPVPPAEIRHPYRCRRRRNRNCLHGQFPRRAAERTPQFQGQLPDGSGCSLSQRDASHLHLRRCGTHGRVYRQLRMRR